MESPLPFAFEVTFMKYTAAISDLEASFFLALAGGGSVAILAFKSLMLALLESSSESSPLKKSSSSLFRPHRWLALLMPGCYQPGIHLSPKFYVPPFFFPVRV